MLSETIALPTHIKDQENRFLVSLKGHLLKHVKEINKLEKEHSEDVFRADSIYNFPNLGKEGIFYIDTTNNKIYRWDETDNKYYCVGSDYNDIKVIDGGNANGNTDT